MATKRGLILLMAALLLNTSGIMNLAQAETQLPSPDMSIPVYYNPNGGKNFHGDQRCRSVNKRYLPLSQLTLANLYAAPYNALTPCPYCSPPPKPHIPVNTGGLAAIGIGISDLSQAGAQLPGTIPLTAEYAILYDLSAGQILCEKNATQRCEPASLTKLLSVLTAYVNGGENIQYTVGREITLVGSNSSTAYLRKGNVLSFNAIVDAVLLPSGNDAAYTLAVNVARYVEGKKLSDEDALSVFADLMNETAYALGCSDSHFVSVDGYPNSDHYSTAYDMLRIAIAAASTPVIVKSVIKSRAYHVFISNREVIWETTNLLLNHDSGFYYQYATGMKTGSTGEVYHLAASAQKDGTSLIAIVLGANSDENRFREAVALLEYGFGR